MLGWVLGGDRHVCKKNTSERKQPGEVKPKCDVWVKDGWGDGVMMDRWPNVQKDVPRAEKECQDPGFFEVEDGILDTDFRSRTAESRSSHSTLSYVISVARVK